MKTWVKIRRWTWELPQTLVGAAIALLHKEKPLRVIEYADQKVYLYDKFNGGISLGYYSHIDWNAKDHNNNVVRRGLKTSVSHEAKGARNSEQVARPLVSPPDGLAKPHTLCHLCSTRSQMELLRIPHRKVGRQNSWN